MKPVYLDHHATTPVDPRVLEEMLPYLLEVYGNASSDHAHGAAAFRAVEQARKLTAQLIGANAKDIVFTSGATESNNLAILGFAESIGEARRHAVTSTIEHPAVLDAFSRLETLGWDVTRLPVDGNGLHTVEQVASALREETSLVSIMAANNEIGVLQPVAEIGALTKERGVAFHTDATQAAALVDLDVDRDGIDLLSLSAHKMYGPKGVGALYVRRRPRRIALEPRVYGGGHERGMRSGTLNVPGIVGLGKACELARSERTSDALRIATLRDQLMRSLLDKISSAEINGDAAKRLPNNLNVWLPGIEARSMLVVLQNSVSISTGSACTSEKVEPSHVIEALGGGSRRAHESIRVGLGRTTSADEIGLASHEIVEAARRVSALSAL